MKVGGFSLFKTLCDRFGTQGCQARLAAIPLERKQKYKLVAWIPSSSNAWYKQSREYVSVISVKSIQVPLVYEAFSGVEEEHRQCVDVNKHLKIKIKKKLRIRCWKVLKVWLSRWNSAIKRFRRKKTEAWTSSLVNNLSRLCVKVTCTYKKNQQVWITN